MKLKAIKLFQNGKYLRDVYPFATRFEVIKYRVQKFTRKVFQWFTLSGIVAVIILVSFIAGQYSTPVSYVKAETVDSLPSKILKLKASVVADLKGCESAGYKEQDGLIILDTNNKMSIGQLQFQIDTVQYYSKTLYKKPITRKEAVMIALNTVEAEKLATEVIFNTDKGLSNWINCANRLGLKEKVNIIKQLEK